MKSHSPRTRFVILALLLGLLLATCQASPAAPQVEASAPSDDRAPAEGAAQNTPAPRRLPPTWTPEPPTATPLPTDPPTVFIIPTHPSPSIDPSLLENCRADELSLTDNMVLRRQRQTNETRILIPAWNNYDLVHFSASADCSLAALEYQPVNTNISSLELLDLRSGQAVIVDESEVNAEDSRPAILDAALSPDGQWLSYLLLVAEDDKIHFPDGRDPHAKYDVYLAAPLAGERFKIGGWEGDVSSSVAHYLLWSPDGKQLAWFDQNGVWVSVGGEAGKLALANGDGRYAILDWSPAGRFLRLSFSSAQGVTQMALDAVSGQSEEIPYSLINGSRPAEIRWQADGSLQIRRVQAEWQAWQVAGDDTLRQVSDFTDPAPALTATLGIVPEGLARTDGSGAQTVMIANPPGSQLRLFSASADGSVLALGYALPGQQLFRLELRGSGVLTPTVVYEGPLATETSESGRGKEALIGVSVAPDGTWVAYLARGTLPGQRQPETPGLAGQDFGVIYLVSPRRPAQSLEFGFCGRPNASERPTSAAGSDCRPPLLWSQDGQRLAWANTLGVWVQGLNEKEAALASERAVRLESWSPGGGYWLVQDPGAAEVGASRPYILSVAHDRKISLPAGLLPPGPWYPGEARQPQIRWLAEGILGMMRYLEVQETWQVTPGETR